MCGPLAQWVVLNVVLLVPEPLVFLSNWFHRAGVASHLWWPGVTHSLLISILDFLLKTHFSRTSCFTFFVTEKSPKDIQNHPKEFPSGVYWKQFSPLLEVQVEIWKQWFRVNETIVFMVWRGFRKPLVQPLAHKIFQYGLGDDFLWCLSAWGSL